MRTLRISLTPMRIKLLVRRYLRQKGFSKRLSGWAVKDLIYAEPGTIIEFNKDVPSTSWIGKALGMEETETILRLEVKQFGAT